MAWNTRFTGGSVGTTKWSTGDQPSAAEFNFIGDDIRTWGGPVDAGAYDLTNLGNLYLNATKKLGIGTATPGAALHIITASDLNVAHLKLEPSGVGNHAGVSFWTAGGATMRNWQIQNNYNSAGGLSVMVSATNIGNPTTSALELYSDGGMALPLLPGSNPGAGSKKLYYDAADGNTVKFAA